jgi:trehalose 6-phosphate phosphatase
VTFTDTLRLEVEMATNCNYDDALNICLSALSVHPAALFSDIDGTLSVIAQRPEDATIAPAVDAALQLLDAHLELVALVTGRSIASARTMTTLSGISIIGNHGFERSFSGLHSIHPDAAESPQMVSEAMNEIKSSLLATGGLEGLVFENKSLSGSVHYRLSPDREAAETRILEVAQRATAERPLRVTLGQLVIEIRPDLDVDKGSAIGQAIVDYGIEGAVFLGDDTTDVDGFMTLQALRESGMATASIAVVSQNSNPDVALAADACIDGVAETLRLLQDLNHSLTENSRS